MLTPQQAKQIAVDAAKNVANEYNADSSAKRPLYELSLEESMKKVEIPFTIYSKPQSTISVCGRDMEHANVVQRYSPSMKELPPLGLTGLLAKRLKWCPRETQKAVGGVLILVQYLPDADTVKIVKEVPFRGVSRPLYNQANSPITMKYDFEAPVIPDETAWVPWNGVMMPSWLEYRTVGAIPPTIEWNGRVFPGTKGTVQARTMFYAPVITEFSGSGVWIVRQKCKNGKNHLKKSEIVLQ